MNCIPYYRVSTKKQGRSGLGLDAQRAAVEQFVRQHEGYRIIAEFQEMESGKRSDNRPELMKAVSHARMANATLVVAKLDRLARNVAFLSTLMESRISFVCVDNPHASTFTVHILAAVAEWEAKQISTRTKEALAQAKKRGVKLGSDRVDANGVNLWASNKRQEARRQGLADGRPAASRKRIKEANEAYEHLYDLMAEMRSGGMSLRKIAARLNELGHATRRGRPWNGTQVMHVLHRGAVLAAK